MRALLARPEVTPRLREVRAPEHEAEDVLDLLLASPLLRQLRCLDFTNTLSNRGAAVLYENAAKLDDVEELWVATTAKRRDAWRRFATDAAGGRTVEAPARGQLEITDDWRQRLRQRFGRRVRFDVRPGHPNL